MGKIKHHIIDGYKVCTKCNINKPIDCYNKCNKTKSGIHGQCKMCKSDYGKSYNLKYPEIKKEYSKINAETARIRAKKWREDFPDRFKKAHKKHYEENKELISKKCEEYRSKNKEKIKERDRLYSIKNKDKNKLRAKSYRENNKDYIRGQKKIWKENKRNTDPLFKFNESVSSGIRRCLDFKKNGKSWVNFVEYTKEELINNIESKFTKGMTWENYGKDGWELDHILPQIYFKHNMDYNHPAFKACWSLENLQPLWATTNIAISYGEDSSYVGNSDKQHRIEITPKIKKFLDEVNGEVNGEESK